MNKPSYPAAYRIIHKPTGHFYVGSSGNMKARELHHRGYLRSGDHHNKKLQFLYNDNPDIVFEIIEVETKESSILKEQELIDQYRDNPLCLNEATDATHPNRGRKLPKEWREALSVANTGRIMDEEWRAKLSAAKQGTVQTDAVKQKRSETMKDIIKKEGGWQKKAADASAKVNSKPLSIDGVVYPSLTQAAKNLNMDDRYIYRRLKSTAAEFSNWFYIDSSKETTVMDNNEIDPGEDGVSHLNIWSGAKTALGRDLSNLSNLSMTHPVYGSFACLEGYWWWLATGQERNEMRMLSGFEARKYGKTQPRVEDPDFNKKFKEGMYWRLAQHPQLSDTLRMTLRHNQMEFKHYYVYGKEPGKQKIVDVSHRHQWQLDFYEWWAELPDNVLLGKPVDFYGGFTEYELPLLKEVLMHQLGASLGARQWAKDVIVGTQLTKSDADHVYDNYRVWHESRLDDLLLDENDQFTFRDIVDMYIEGLPKPKKYVVLKGEFRTDTADVINALQMLGYTVLSSPRTLEEPVVVGDNSDPELAEALASVNVLVLTEQHVLNQEVV